MSTNPTPPASDEADPEQQTTPAGQVGELEELIEETGADVTPSTVTPSTVTPSTVTPLTVTPSTADTQTDD